jgi:hypothetical protein
VPSIPWAVIVLFALLVAVPFLDVARSATGVGGG